MQHDPAIERVREVRHRISAECGHDPRKLVQYYLDRQHERQRRLKAQPLKAEPPPRA